MRRESGGPSRLFADHDLSARLAVFNEHNIDSERWQYAASDEAETEKNVFPIHEFDSRSSSSRVSSVYWLPVKQSVVELRLLLNCGSRVG